MKVRLFSDYRMQEFEDEVNEFLSDLNGEVSSIKYAISSAPDGDGYVCDRYSALVIFRDVSPWYINEYDHDLRRVTLEDGSRIDTDFVLDPHNKYVTIDGDGRVYVHVTKPIPNTGACLWSVESLDNCRHIGSIGRCDNWQEMIWERKNTNQL